MRLQQYLSRAGVCARRAAEELIVHGVVKVNGETVTQLGTKVDPGVDQVSVRDELVRINSPKLIMFHKPPAVVSTLCDTHGRKTIADFIPTELGRLFPVGRLDYDVHGLLLLTNDGDFAEHLLHPRYEVPRVYEARVRGEFDQSAIEMLQNGVKVDKSIVRVRSVRELPSSRYLKPINSAKSVGDDEDGGRVNNIWLRRNQSLVELTVAEGSKHLVKNLLAVVGHPVIELCRISFGPYRLGNLKQGQLKAIEFQRLGV